MRVVPPFECPDPFASPCPSRMPLPHAKDHAEGHASSRSSPARSRCAAERRDSSQGRTSPWQGAAVEGPQEEEAAPLKLTDAGVAFNVPLPPLLRPERGVEVC